MIKIKEIGTIHFGQSTAPKFAPTEYKSEKVVLNPDPLPAQTKTATPTTSQQEVEADEGYCLEKVVVEAVTADIDENIVPENIRENVEILGVTGDITIYEKYEGEIENNGND